MRLSTNPRHPAIGTNGPPRTKGARLPTLTETLNDAATSWQRITVAGWYGEGERIIDITAGTAVWRHAGMPVVPIRWLLVHDPLGRFQPQALLCTDAQHDPEQVLRWFVQRWQLEVMFEEARAHLGVEAQRQWSDRAIARTTPCRLGLFSLVALLAVRLSTTERRAAMGAAWYRKSCPTFSDTLTAVRRHLWREQGLFTSSNARHITKPKPALQSALVYAVCHAA